MASYVVINKLRSRSTGFGELADDTIVPPVSPVAPVDATIEQQQIDKLTALKLFELRNENRRQWVAIGTLGVGVASMFLSVIIARKFAGGAIVPSRRRRR